MSTAALNQRKEHEDLLGMHRHASLLDMSANDTAIIVIAERRDAYVVPLRCRQEAVRPSADEWRETL